MVGVGIRRGHRRRICGDALGAYVDELMQEGEALALLPPPCGYSRAERNPPVKHSANIAMTYARMRYQFVMYAVVAESVSYPA